MRREVRVGDGDALGELEVVVEAVLDRRADRDLHARIELHHRGGQHVRGVVADELERVVGERSVTISIGSPVRQRPGEVAHLAVDLDRERGARQPGPIAAAASAPVAPSASSAPSAGASGSLERRIRAAQ